MDGEPTGGTAVVDAPGSGATGQQGEPTAHPSSERSGAGDKAANTAPAASLHREAFDRLAKGERPDAVNRALYAPKPKAAPEAPAGEARSTGQQPAEPADQAQKPQPGKSHGYPDGTSDKDVQVLRRAKMDPQTWAAIPPSNRVKILAGLRESQAAADREFQRRAQAAGNSKARTPAEPATQTPTDGQDVETSGASVDLANSDDGAAGAAPATAAAPATPPPAANPATAQVDPAQFIDPKDLETLQLIGGDDLAQTLSRTTQRIVSHFAQREAVQHQQTSQLLNVVDFLLNDHVEAQFNRGLDQLAELPGLEDIRDESRAAERDALRKKADLLHRAAGDPRSYTYQEAIRDAAASLFRIDIHQTAQARLLAGRTQSLRGTPQPPTQRRGAEAKPLTPKERNSAIFAELQRGASPEEARAIVDGR